MSYVNITKANFEDLVLKSEKTVLLDFWAPWCGPCRMVAPVVEAISDDREDILLGKVNVDEEMELAMEFGVSSIPLLVVMKNGKVTAQSVGYMPRADSEKLLDKHPKSRKNCGTSSFSPFFSGNWYKRFLVFRLNIERNCGKLF